MFRLPWQRAATNILKHNQNVSSAMREIRIKLEQDRTTLIPLPDFETAHADNADCTSNIIEKREEKLISWQEKIFSPFEVSYYTHIGNCHNPLEEKYHNEVTTLFKGCVPSRKIFTYTNADNFSEIEHTNSLTSETKSVSTVLGLGMSEMQQKRRFRRNKSHLKEIRLANRHIVDFSPTDEIKKTNHFLQCSFQSFYILADLSPKESSEQEDWIGRSEYVLCTIKYDTDSNIVYVTPDFSSPALNGQSTPYYIEVDGDSRNVYQYWLEHASESLVEEDKEKEEAILCQLLGRQLDIRQMKVGTEFDVPHRNIIMMYILGEIVCAEEFEYNDLFVHFLFELPKDSVPSWPQLFVEVLSLDSWGRFRVEGYCFLKVPPHPGQHHFALPTWRPITNGPSGELRRFFIGGAPGFEDLSSVGIPATFEGAHLSKLGLKTTGSGIVHLRLNILHQSSEISSDTSNLENSENRNRHSFLLERLSASTIVNSVNSVMTAFKKARERMIRAREGLDI
ncbi:Meckel syndrome type 1 protein [Gryllus bimaculatus]|nr:Meckel syndrome type 1 protein [Gryllus bimaculatus]